MARSDPGALRRVRALRVPWRAGRPSRVVTLRGGPQSRPAAPVAEPTAPLIYPAVMGWPYGYAVNHTVPMDGYQGPTSTSS